MNILNEGAGVLLSKPEPKAHKTIIIMANSNFVNGVSKHTLKRVRLAYVCLDKARGFKSEEGGDDDKPCFRVTAMIPKSDKEAMKRLKEDLQKAEDEGTKLLWNGKTPKGRTYRGIDGVFADGDDSENPEFAGHWLLLVKSPAKSKPTLFQAPGEPLDEFTPITDKFYSGCYAHVLLSTFAYNNNGQGLSVSLEGVMFYKDGEKFSGGGRVSSDDFDLDEEDMDDDI